MAAARRGQRSLSILDFCPARDSQWLDLAGRFSLATVAGYLDTSLVYFLGNTLGVAKTSKPGCLKNKR